MCFPIFHLKLQFSSVLATPKNILSVTFSFILSLNVAVGAEFLCPLQGVPHYLGITHNKIDTICWNKIVMYDDFLI